MNDEQNTCNIIGKIGENFAFSHETHGEKFYKSKLLVPRLSGTIDVIPICISELLTNINAELKGENVFVVGSFRSYDAPEEIERYVFVDEMFSVPEDEARVNILKLNGFIVKKPTYRKKKLGREISDILVAVNRKHGRTDYIRCIAWGRNAYFLSTLNVGANVEFIGRIQSRKYNKKIGERYEERTAYELSVQKLQYFGGGKIEG